MEEIIQQLVEYCNCLPEDILKPNKRPQLEKIVMQMIDLISVMTCWASKPCETFFNSERTEIIDLEEFDACNCCDGIVGFTPYYKPFNKDSFRVRLVILDGINETIKEIDDKYYKYSETFCELRIDIRNYASFNKCGCPKGYKLRITYDAGYELIPDCLLPLFCDILHVIYEKNNCDCWKCKTCNEVETSADVTIEYDEGDTLSPLINTYLNTLLLNGYKKQLKLMSICEYCSDIWGVVV